MSGWMMWLAAAGVLMILEIFSGTFYLLMLALGVAAAAAAAWFDAPLAVQLLLAAVVGAAATATLRRCRPHSSDAARNPDINLDIGQTLHVAQWHRGVARSMYRGAMWDVELAPGAEARAGQFVIQEIRGSHLIVTNQPEAKP